MTLIILILKFWYVIDWYFDNQIFGKEQCIGNRCLNYGVAYIETLPEGGFWGRNSPSKGSLGNMYK